MKSNYRLSVLVKVKSSVKQGQIFKSFTIYLMFIMKCLEFLSARPCMGLGDIGQHV